MMFFLICTDWPIAIEGEGFMRSGSILKTFVYLPMGSLFMYLNFFLRQRAIARSTLYKLILVRVFS